MLFVALAASALVAGCGSEPAPDSSANPGASIYADDLTSEDEEAVAQDEWRPRGCELGRVQRWLPVRVEQEL